VTAPALDQFQLDTLSFLDHARGRAVLADPMGARKTGTTLAWLATQAVRHTLVVAPSAVHGHWAREAHRYYPKAHVISGQGAGAQRHLKLEGVLHDSEPVLYIVTYETMKQDQHKITVLNFDAIVFDEGHRLKGRTTQVSKCANAITKKARHIICATGTPVLNHASELWQYLHMLAPRVYPAYWGWAEAHYKVEIKNFKGNRFPTRIVHGFRSDEEADRVRHQIEPFFIQRDIHELFPGQAWVEEPEHVEIEVELSAPERKVYDTLVKHKWAIVGGREITTSNALDRTTRLNQIVSDWSTVCPGLDEGTKVRATVELAFDLLERDEPVVIFAKYKATVAALKLAFNSKNSAYAVDYTGDQSMQEREIALNLFIKGKAKVIIGTLDSMSEGVDGMQHVASNIIMVDRHWTPAKNDQAIGRLRRSGQLKRVTVYHIFAANTIDATITSACLRKLNVIQVLKNQPLIDSVYGRTEQ